MIRAGGRRRSSGLDGRMRVSEMSRFMAWVYMEYVGYIVRGRESSMSMFWVEV
jgi:hypothetical protein